MSRPTKPGYYWIQPMPGVYKIVEVVPGPDNCMLFLITGSPIQQVVENTQEGIWCGEITRKKNKPNARVRAQRRKSADGKL